MSRSAYRWGAVVLVAVLCASIVLGIALSSGEDKPEAKTSVTPAVSEPTSAESVQPTSTPSESRKRPRIRVVGFCASGRGTVFLHGEGFTPNGKYVTEAMGPDHKPYTRLHNPGTASPTGTTPNWRWECEAVDKPGEYGLRLFDLESQQYSNTTGFEILKP